MKAYFNWNEFDWIVKTVRPLVLIQLETLRSQHIIGKSNEADIIISANKIDYLKLLNFEPSLSEIFNTSSVELKLGEEKELSIIAAKSVNKLCNRCKRYTSDVNNHPYWPGEKYAICKRCVEVLLEISWPPFILITDNDYYICKNELEWHDIKTGIISLPV